MDTQFTSLISGQDCTLCITYLTLKRDERDTNRVVYVLNNTLVSILDSRTVTSFGY